MAAGKYSEKPVVVDAIEYDGTNIEEVMAFCEYVIYNEATQQVKLFGLTEVTPGMWIYKEQSGAFNAFGADFLTYYKPEGAAKVVFISRYEPRPITAVEAVTWTGENFIEVQVVCPQATKAASTISIMDVGEVYVGEVVCRDLTSGKFSKMKAELFNVFYQGQTI